MCILDVTLSPIAYSSWGTVDRIIFPKRWLCPVNRETGMAFIFGETAQGPSDHHMFEVSVTNP